MTVLVKNSKRRGGSKANAVIQPADAELEVLPGLESFSAREARTRPGVKVLDTEPGRVLLHAGDRWTSLRSLKTVVAAKRVLTFDINRPRGLLGHQAFQQILSACGEIVQHFPRGEFKTFRLSAAGADSTVFQRFRQELGSGLGLREVDQNPNLLVAARPALSSKGGWEVTVRTTQRPLSARPWRVCNYPVALDATVARVMVELCGIHPGSRFLNLTCGSGTLLVERVMAGPSAQAVGVDINADALHCAQQNLDAAGSGDRCALLNEDATRTSLDAESFDTIVADLPFGLVDGSPDDLESLYSGVIREATRLAAPSANMALITTRAEPLRQALSSVDAMWGIARTFRVSIPAGNGYIKPHVFHLRRS